MAKGLEIGKDAYAGDRLRSGENDASEGQVGASEGQDVPEGQDVTEGQAVPEGQDVTEGQGGRFSRRHILQALGVLSAIPTALTIYHSWQYGRQIAATIETVRNRVNLPRALEFLPNGFIVPENERTGKDILASVDPSYSPAPILGGYDFSKTIPLYLTPLLSQLQDGTNVHILFPENSGDDYLDQLKTAHPNLTFFTYGLPSSEGGLTFPQDVVFPTGRQVLGDGRFIIAASSLEAKQFNPLAKAQQDKRRLGRLFEPLVSSRNFRSWLIADEGDVEKAAGGVHDFGDEFLAERYPDKFLLKYVPVATTGGDLQVTRLPNGRSAAIVGKENLSRTVLSMQMEESPDADVTDLNEIDPEKFARFLDRAKEAYRQYLGVNDVIFIDEPNIRRQINLGARISHEWLKSYDFFHSDMIVKTATASDGRGIAFCSDQAVKGPDSGYLWRIQEQFVGLGYDVKLLGCGPCAAMNYTNSVMFKPTRHSKTVVMLPQYGAPGDEEAAKVYESCGFEVRKVDMSAISRLPIEDRMTTGSLHCRAVVMS